MSAKSAGSESPEKLHTYWDKVVSAAYLRVMGATQIEAANAVGRSERTIRDWESDEKLWGAARAEAAKRWLNDAQDAARRAVLKSLQLNNAELGKWLLERTMAELAPVQKHHVSSPDEGPVEILITRRIVHADGRDD